MYTDRQLLIQRYAPFVPGIPQPEQDWDECPRICVSFNETWVPLIIGALQTLTWSDLYAGDVDRAELIARQAGNLIVAFANGNIECGCDMAYKLRQKPGYPCVLEQSVDGGVSWSIAFDFSLCQPLLTPISEQQAEQNYYDYSVVSQHWGDIYNGTVASVAPDMVMDAGPNDDLRNLAMCYALNLLVATLAAQADKQINHQIDWRDVVIIGAAVAAAVSTVAGVAVAAGVITVTGKYVIALSIASVIPGIASTILALAGEPMDVSDVLDPAVQRALICSAMGVLRDNTPDIITFGTIFDSVPPGTSDDDTIEVLKQLVGNEQVYVDFLAFMQSAYTAFANGQTFECPCGTYEYWFDFTAESGVALNTTYGQHSWYVDTLDAGRGTYTSGVGWVFTDETTGDYTNARGVVISLDNITGNITEVVCHFDRVAGVDEPGASFQASIYYGGDVQRWLETQMPQGVDVSISRVATRDLTAHQLITEILSDIRFGPYPPFTGSGILKKIQVKGYGSVPSAFLPT